MKFLVTGGAGFIGSNLTDVLIEKGHEVIVIDNLSKGKKENINPKATFYQLDITDEKAIEPIFAGIDGVFHLAALAALQPSFDNPELYFKVNCLGTANVLMAAKNHKVKRVVYSASASAYGLIDKLPLNEDFEISSQALNPYASTKRIGEMLMRDFGKLTGGPETVCLRYFNAYGPRQTTAADGAYATVIGIFFGLLKQNKPLPIVPDGYQRRDFVWVEDIAEANILAMSSLKVGNGEIINIGSGNSYSVWDTAKLILDISTDTDPKDLLTVKKCFMAPERRGEIKESLADISKAKKMLGWEPKTELKKGIEKLFKFYGIT